MALSDDEIKILISAAVEGTEKLDKFQEQLGTIKQRMLDMAAVLASGETAQYIAEQIKASAETANFAASLGLATETLSGYQAILKKFGVDAETTNDALGSLTEKIYEAAESGSDASELFSALGVAVTDISGRVRPTEQVLADLANGMKNSGNETANSAVALGLFGDVGLKLLPVLAQGADGIKTLTDAAKENGEVLSNEQGEAAKKAAAALAQMTADAAAAGRELAITLAPAVEYAAALTRDLIDVTEFLGASLGNLAYSIANLDFGDYQSRQKELFTELSDEIAKNHAEIGKAAEAIENAGKKAQDSAKQTGEFGWNLTIATRAATDLAGTLDEILKRPLDATGATQLGLALEVAGQKAGNTSAIITEQLTSALSNLSNDQLQTLREASQQAFEAGRLGAEQYAQVLTAISTGALAQLGVDTERLKSGFAETEKKALDLFQTVTDSAQSSSTAIEAGLLQTLQSIKSPAGLAELQTQFETLKESGRLTEEQLAGLSPLFDQITEAVGKGIQPGAEFDALLTRLQGTAEATAAGVSGLEQAFTALGLSVPAALQSTADAAAVAFKALQEGEVTLSTQQQGWLVYADAALKAAEAAGKPAPEIIKQQAAALGLTAAYEELRRSTQTASAEFDALAAAADRNTEAFANRQQTFAAEIEAQGAIADAATQSAIAIQDETAAIDAAVQASQARIDAARQEADSLQAAAEASAIKLAALQAEAQVSQTLSDKQLEALQALREEVQQKLAAADAARARANAVQDEEEATGRLNAAMTAAQRVIAAQYGPLQDLAEARIATAQASIQAADAAGDEAGILEDLIELRAAEADAARLAAEAKQAEAQAAQQALTAIRAQAIADGELTQAEQKAIETAEALVAARQKTAAAAQQLAEATQKAADATAQQNALTDQQRESLKESAGQVERLTLATTRFAGQLIAAFDVAGIQRFTSVAEALDGWVQSAANAATRLNEALQEGDSTALQPLISSAKALVNLYTDAQGYNDELIRKTRNDLKEAIEAATAAMKSFTESQKEALESDVRRLEDLKAAGDELRQADLDYRRELDDLNAQIAEAERQHNTDAIKLLEQRRQVLQQMYDITVSRIKAEQLANQDVTDTGQVETMTKTKQIMTDLNDTDLSNVTGKMRALLDLVRQLHGELASATQSAQALDAAL